MDHDMMASTTAMVMSEMSGMVQTATGTAAMASSTGMSMDDGGMDMGGGCKISVGATTTSLALM